MDRVNLPTLLYPKDILLSDGRPDKQIDSNPITKLMQSDIRWAASVIIARLPANHPPINWVIWNGKEQSISLQKKSIDFLACCSGHKGYCFLVIWNDDLMSSVMYIL